MARKMTKDRKYELHWSRVLHPDDWDERPENICMGCGYKVSNCTGTSENCVSRQKSASNRKS